MHIIQDKRGNTRNSSINEWTDSSLVIPILNSRKTVISARRAILISKNYPSLNRSSCDDTSFATIIGVMTLNTFKISPCWCVTNHSININSIGVAFINYPTVFQMLVLGKKIFNIVLKWTRLILATKYGNNKWIEMASLRQYWPELETTAFEKGEAINIYKNVHVITVTLIQIRTDPLF